MRAPNDAVFVLNGILIVFSVVFLCFLIFCTCWFKCNKRHRKALMKAQRDREHEQQSTQGLPQGSCGPPNFTPQAVQFTAMKDEGGQAPEEQDIVQTTGIQVKLIQN